MSAPDVSVVVPVYNTMPYLTRCLTSLVEQSIGRDRIQVVAVDDGSTDGSGRELDRFAARYPETVTVIHQANSGGPAGPCNRGLEKATGRYVFFLGADDYLGREALERLVSAADEYGSDVVVGKVIGVNNRFISQTIFARNEVDISLFDSQLPYSLSNTKLFRRELIERHGLRYPEHMPMGSDQPFTVAACVHARRISVLADYDFYYAVRRLNARNITYSSRHDARLHSVESIMDIVAGLIGPGKERDAVLLRHFAWEAAKLLADDFLRLDREVQQRVRAGIGRLVGQYLTDPIRERLGVEARLRLSIAREGSLEDLLAVIAQDAERGVPPTVVEGERWYAAYPGFREPHLSLPDSWFDVTESAADWVAKLDATAVDWEATEAGRVLTVTARSPLPDLPDLCAGGIAMSAGDVSAAITVTPEPDGTVVRARFSLDRLVADTAPLGGRRPIRTVVTAFDTGGTATLRAPRFPSSVPVVSRRGTRLYLVTPRRDHTGQLVITIVHITMRRVLARLGRMWAG